MIDSHGSLGINARASDRVQYCRVTTCSPIDIVRYNASGIDRVPNDISYGDKVINYTLGPNGNTSYTYSYDTRSDVGGFGYQFTYVQTT